LKLLRVIIIAVVLASALGLGACAQHREVVTPPAAKGGKEIPVHGNLIRADSPKGQVVLRPGLFLPPIQAGERFNVSMILSKLPEWS